MANCQDDTHFLFINGNVQNDKRIDDEPAHSAELVAGRYLAQLGMQFKQLHAIQNALRTR